MALKKVKKKSFSFGRGVGAAEASEMITKIVYYAINVFEEEQFETSAAQLEANKLVFSFEHPLLNFVTIAQWISRGGDETKAHEAIRDYILTSKKREQKTTVQKVVIARVFGGK